MSSWAIIGASRGIGLEYVRQLSADPTNTVFALVRDAARAEHLQPLAAAHKTVHVLAADLTDHRTLKAAADAVASRAPGGALDVLVVNGAKTGGALYFTPLTEYAGREDEVDAEYTDAFRTNVLGPLHATTAFLPLLRLGCTRKIICISSSAADLGEAQRAGSTMMAAYACTKAALNMLVLQLANTLRSERFVCVALSPGIVNTSETTAGKRFDDALRSIHRAYADWTPVAYTPGPAESVTHQLATIARLAPGDSGAFLSEKGRTVLYED
ncbi:NAD-P-binding protein [Vararia minispora EC-137]|uniref:NAD-P-binding protein n=1 Tax=Vararia minispora EC-137 TaxID=1314806 RepID=A0ACB8QML2_9AGAM|nr:NAD-P-binding protein [Vararia minispora EC-137]